MLHSLAVKNNSFSSDTVNLKTDKDTYANTDTDRDTYNVQDPRPGTDTHIKIRLGSHSGQVVGGIVGNKCPR